MRKLFVLILCATMALSIGCQKEAEPVAPDPQTEDNVNSGQCPDCRLWTCTNRLHDLCDVCHISRRPPRGCMCTPSGGGGSESDEPEGEPVPPGTPAIAYLVKPDNNIYLSPSEPSQTRTIYYNNRGYWKRCMGLIKISYDSSIWDYLSLPEESGEDGTLVFRFPSGAVIPPNGVWGNYRIGHINEVAGQIVIKP